jgi:hypothetical protein
MVRIFDEFGVSRLRHRILCQRKAAHFQRMNWLLVAIGTASEHRRTGRHIQHLRNKVRRTESHVAQ